MPLLAFARRIVGAGILLAAGVAGFAPRLAAEQPPPAAALPIDDAFSIKTFQVYEGGPAVSPDSKWVASVVCDPAARAKDKSGEMTIMVATRGAAMYSFGCDIVVGPVDGRDARNVTASVGNNWAPSWSPDGNTLAFYSDRGGAPHLWLWDRRSGATRRGSDAVVRTGVGLQHPLWLPDGAGVLVTLRPEGISDAELDADLPGRKGDKSEPKPEADSVPGSTVKVYRSSPPKTDASDTSSSPAAPVSLRYLSDLAKIDLRTRKASVLVRRANALLLLLSPDGRRLAYFELKPGGGGTLVYPHDIVLVDLATGSRRVLASDVPADFGGSASWSPDGQRIAYLIAEAAASGTLQTGGTSQTRGSLAVISVDGEGARRFTPIEPADSTAEAKAKAKAKENTSALFDAQDHPALWGRDGSAIYVVGDNRVWRATLADFRVAPLTAKLDAKITAIVPSAELNTVWNPAPGTIAVTTSDPVTLRSAFQTVATDGTVTRRLEEQKRYAVRSGALHATPDGRLVLFDAESSAAPEDRWSTTSDFGAPARVTHLNPQVEKYPPGESRVIEFRSEDGELLRAALFLPAGYEAGKRYPLIALVYASGMGSRDVNSFGIDYMGEYNYQILTTRGYAILCPDIPVHTGSPMRDLMKAVMPAIDRVVELGIADPDRLGVTGQSNGGYSTLALICQTNRFKAAVMNSGFGDLVGFYGSMNRSDGSGGWHPWLEKLGGAMGVPPWENPFRYVENSPIFYLDRVQTPLLMQAGAEDEGIVSYSDQVFVALKRLQKDVTYLRYRDESHLLERHANKLDYWNRVLPFWERHLKGPVPAREPEGPR